MSSVKQVSDANRTEGLADQMAWRSQLQRTMEELKISTESMPSELIAAMALVKRARALAPRGSALAVQATPKLVDSQALNSFVDDNLVGLHVATSVGIAHNLQPALAGLHAELLSKADFFGMNAQPKYAAKIAGQAAQLAEVCNDIAITLPLAHNLPLICDAEGTGQQVAEALAEALNLPFVATTSASMSGNEALIKLQGHLKVAAGCLMNISNTMRTLSPASNETTQCDALTMVCCQVVSSDTALSLKPLLAHQLLASLRLLSDAATIFTEYFLRGAPLNGGGISQGMARSLMRVTSREPQVA